jgi:FkbM family methyltransferase
MKIRKLYKYISNYEYYFEYFARRLSGKANMDPFNNGEYLVLEKIIKQANEEVFFVDGGANIGNHSKTFISLCKKYNKKPNVYAFEPFPDTFKKLEKNLLAEKAEIFMKALGEDRLTKTFYFNKNNPISGTNSTFKHYYLNDEIKIQQDTIDNYIEILGIEKVDLLKLDVEGSELLALKGAEHSLDKNIFKYIQLEYNQTWLKSGADIKQVLDICKKYGYSLFRLSNRGLFSISDYNYNLDDFIYSNLLLVSSNEQLPIPVLKKAIPI